MAIRNILFDEVIVRCIEDFLGEEFSDFSDEIEEEFLDYNESESEDDVGEDESVSSSDFEDLDVESDSNGMCFVCLFVLVIDFIIYFRYRLVFLCFFVLSI